ncbi:hypothetical protein ACOCJ5_04790 [Knoellia sp. CPCC 206450]|uniref:hypothetical protein n=1 Tax=Knoellia tibetensis TaxID=3404798 RepID=UPI003B429B32
MPDGPNEAIAELEQAITRLAKGVRADAGPGANRDQAEAINHLAEARAWLKTTAQPHGGIGSHSS